VIGISIMGGGMSFAMVGSINMLIISTPQRETAISSAMNMIIRTSGGVVGPAVATVIIAAYSPETAYKIVFMMSAIVMILGAAVALALTDKRALGEGKGFHVRSFRNGNSKVVSAETVSDVRAREPK
jgi:MFS family permease